MNDEARLIQRNIKMVVVSGELFSNWMRVGFTPEGIVCTKGVPRDSTYMGAAYLPESDCVGMIFYHPSFEPVIEGDRLPQVVCEFQYIKHQE